MSPLPQTTKTQPHPLCGFQNTISVCLWSGMCEIKKRQLFSPRTTFLYEPTIGWASRKTSFMFSNFINVFPILALPFSLFLLASGLSCLSLAALTSVFSLDWPVSMLNIVRISCSLSWHCFLKETFPSLVQAKELLPWGESWSADWKHAWLLV